MTNTADDGVLTHLTPEEAMDQVRRWTDSRVVGERATNRLEILAAHGVHVALANVPGEILVKMAWRTPTCVELSVVWTLGSFMPLEPAPYVADKLTDLATSWTLENTASGARLVCLVEDD